jgi:hypothetical protein
MWRWIEEQLKNEGRSELRHGLSFSLLRTKQIDF